MIEKLKQDTIFNGAIYGVVSFFTAYLIFFGLNYCWTDILQKQNYLPSPKLELLAMFFTVLLFRMMMVKYKRTETGKGILFMITLTTLAYIFIKGVHL
jgi:tryptophan-rich sensory protein